jgi:hypothetical protein
MRRRQGPNSEAGARPPWLLRAFLVAGALQGYAIGLTGLVSPGHIVGFPLDTTALNDRFVASFYLAGAIGLTLSALVHSAWDARVLVTAFGAVTILLLVATVAYWSEFTTDGVPYPWLVSYIVDPGCAAVAIASLGLWTTELPRRDAIGVLFLAEAILCIAIGVLLVAAPGTAIDLWPWHLTAILARVYGSIFLALGLAAVLSAQERRASALVPFLCTSLAFGAGGLLCYALHSSRFDGGAATDVWLVANGLAVTAFGSALFVLSRAASR